MQHNRMFLSLRYVAPLLASKKCIQCGNAKLWEYTPLLCSLNWTMTKMIHSRTATDTSITSKEPQLSLFKRILQKLKIIDLTAARAHASGLSSYELVADRIDYDVFYKDFNMPDTFFSWFLVTELHVWMLMVRFMAEGKYGHIARNSLVEEMWVDVNNRVKLLGKIAPSVKRKQINDLSGQFNAAVIAYDEGLLSDDKVLAGALWATFFNLENNNPEAIERLIIYIRKQISLLDRIPSQQILRCPDIQWVKFADVNVQKVI